MQQINNPGAPTKTIQHAIDLLFDQLVSTYDPVTGPGKFGVVHLMPGVYSPATNGEHFPIVMRDRVHVRGVSARRCVIRGAEGVDYPNNLSCVRWPQINTPCIGHPGCHLGYRLVQVLVSFAGASRYRVDPVTQEAPPWVCESGPDTEEMIDAVTFQGGDVQVSFPENAEQPLPLTGRISNCVFDMRHHVFDENGILITGAMIGLISNQGWLDEDIQGVEDEGYLRHSIHIVHNTFLMAEFNEPSGTWITAQIGAAGIIDTIDPVCGPGGDPDETPRGLGAMGIQNNLFRTHTGLGKDKGAMAMLGVTVDDVKSNAFHPDKAGAASNNQGQNSTENEFVSVPAVGVSVSGHYAIWDCNGPVVLDLYNAAAGAPGPLPSVVMWDGTGGPTQYDPAFVGEYINTISPVKATYRDWRLLPGSPLKDTGSSLQFPNSFGNGEAYNEPDCDELKFSLWDSDGYGNPRVVDGFSDIGADEIHLGVVCGSFADHSYSHNRAGFLNPFVVNEQSTRFFIAAQTIGTNQTQGLKLRFRINERIPQNPPDHGPAWTVPPGSQVPPTSQGGSLPGYDLSYTKTNSSAIPFAPPYLATVPISIDWPNDQGAPMPLQEYPRYSVMALPADDEGAGFTSWTNLQPYLRRDNPALLLYGDLQPEFR